jgi:hypothetical protein
MTNDLAHRLAFHPGDLPQHRHEWVRKQDLKLLHASIHREEASSIKCFVLGYPADW